MGKRGGPPPGTVNNPKGRPENLGQYSLPREEYLANCAKGARVREERRAKRKALREIAEAILALDLEDNEIKERLMSLGYDEEASMGAGILFAQAKKAMHGDTEAARFVRDTAGQNPTQNIAVGNLDDKPFETINLGELTDEQLQALVAGK